MITNIYCQKMSCGKEVDIQGDFCDMHGEVTIEPKKDTTIEVIKIDEQKDGSAIVELEMSKEAIRLFVQKAFVDILTEMMQVDNPYLFDEMIKVEDERY